MVTTPRHSRIKGLIGAPIIAFLRATARLRMSLGKLYHHAHLASQIKPPLPTSVVLLGRMQVFGTGAVEVGEECFFFPDLYFETQGDARITVGDCVVLSRGVHLVAMAGITIGKGTMIGEYSSIRDANHMRKPGMAMRDAGFVSRPIVVGNEVWIGRGVTILAGVTIGDGATVGANAVVTRDVPAGATVVGIPARPIVPAKG